MVSRVVTVAITQMACSTQESENLAQAEALVRTAAAGGAQIILLQELFAGPYFCKDQDDHWFRLAHPLSGHPWLERFAELARSLEVVLPISYFERAGPAFFNSLATFDADGRLLGNYRKSHIPNGPGYQEKHYFSPGDTGFMVLESRYGRLGSAICWDQWFPETARCLVLKGAEVLLFPTAIGSEPEDPDIDSSDHWQRTMCGHAAANMVPLLASNRIGSEQGRQCRLDFYGRSFIADPTGAKVAEASREEPACLLHSFDLDAIADSRRNWGLFRDRRPDLYGSMMSLDGSGP